MEYGALLISFGFALYVVALVAIWRIIEEHWIPEKGRVWFQLLVVIIFFVVGFWLITGGLKLMTNTT